MTRYLISFDEGAMAHIGDDELPAVAEAARAVVRQARQAGVWIHGGGLLPQRATVVDPAGAVSEGPPPGSKAVIGGLSIIQVPTHEEAVAWAAKFAAACRCPQEVRMLMDDPEV